MLREIRAMISYLRLIYVTENLVQAEDHERYLRHRASCLISRSRVGAMPGKPVLEKCASENETQKVYFQDMEIF